MTVGDINIGDMLYHYIFGGQKKEVVCRSTIA